MQRSRTQLVKRFLCLLALTAIPLAGCYQRVVEARGLGAVGTNTYEPNYKPSQLEKQLLPNPDPPKRKSW